MDLVRGGEVWERTTLGMDEIYRNCINVNVWGSWVQGDKPHMLIYVFIYVFIHIIHIFIIASYTYILVVFCSMTIFKHPKNVCAMCQLPTKNPGVGLYHPSLNRGHQMILGTTNCWTRDWINGMWRSWRRGQNAWIKVDMSRFWKIFNIVSSGKICWRGSLQAGRFWKLWRQKSWSM